METLIGKGLNDLANLVSEKWYAGMGLVGLIILMWVVLKGTPHDDILIGAIAMTMIGIGFAEAETRTFREHIGPNLRYKITQPTRMLTGPGFCLYCLGVGAIMTVIGRSIWLLM